MHDSNLLRTTGTDSSVFELSAQQIESISAYEPARFGDERFPTAIPTLDQTLELFASVETDLRVFAEVKPETLTHYGHASVIEKLRTALEKHHFPVTIISFDNAFLTSVRTLTRCPVGWILKTFDAVSRNRAIELSPDYLICDQLAIPEDTPLWQGRWQWMLYVIGEPDAVLARLKRGASLIETNDVAAMFRFFSPGT